MREIKKMSNAEPKRLMKTYLFPVVIEPDDDRWFACVPELESKGGATWGDTREEALKNMQEVVRMIVEELVSSGEALPRNVIESEQPTIAVTL